MDIVHLKLKSIAVVMQSNIVRYYINNYRNWSNISIRFWTYKRHHIPRPNWRSVACLLWKHVSEPIDGVKTAPLYIMVVCRFTQCMDIVTYRATGRNVHLYHINQNARFIMRNIDVKGCAREYPRLHHLFHSSISSCTHRKLPRPFLLENISGNKTYGMSQSFNRNMITVYGWRLLIP